MGFFSVDKCFQIMIQEDVEQFTNIARSLVICQDVNPGVQVEYFLAEEIYYDKAEAV
jgi:hypothetical protein